MKNRSILNTLIIAGLLCAPYTSALAAEQKSNALTFEDIFNLQAQSYKIIEEPAAADAESDIADAPLNDHQKRSITYNALAQHSTHKTDGTIFSDKNFYRKMDILCGVESPTSLFTLINRTQTTFGQATLARMLCQMTNDVNVLHRRQTIIQKLITDDAFFNEVDRCIQPIKSAENGFIAYLQQEDAAHKEINNKVYFSMGPLKKLNKSTPSLEVSTRLSNLMALPFVDDVASSVLWKRVLISLNLLNLVESATASTYKAFAQSNIFSADEQKVMIESMASKTSPNGNNETLLETISSTIAGIPSSLYLLNAALTSEKLSLKLKIMAGCLGLFLTVQKTYGVYSTYHAEKSKIDTIKRIQTNLINVATCMRECEHLCNAFDTHNLPSEGFEQLRTAAHESAAHSANFNTLKQALACNTFTGEASFFSLAGRVLSTHTIMNEVKNELIPAFECIGEIDAYLSMAKLYKEFESKRVHMSFAQFIDQDTPYVHAHNFWNPFVDPAFVVTNSITMGAAGHPQNIILTGPNTGGKSTVIKGLILNVLLAQTFGMAWADSLVMTPFTNINCYLNISDDISAGTSLFKAEVLRAKDLINAVRALEGKQFSFTIMDEIFSGTSPKEGEQAACKFASKMGNHANSMIVIATHFPLLTELADQHPKVFKNYRVAVDRDANGKITRHYKLEAGKTFMNIAMDLLEEEGIFLD